MYSALLYDSENLGSLRHMGRGTLLMVIRSKPDITKKRKLRYY